MSGGRVVNLRYGPLRDGAVYVGQAVTRRGWETSKWANPYIVGQHGTREECIAKYRDEHLPAHPELIAALPELRGKVLACWCAPGPCHGDVLLRLANGGGD
jgi:hypothetical protein